MSCATAGIYNFICNQGATFRRELTWTDSSNVAINITSYTARMHVRANVNANTTLVVLTTENGRISLGGTNGKVNLLIDAETTANIIPGLYVYDLEMISSGNEVTRLIEGNFKVTAEVTR
jgi:hypothetical protein